MTNKLCTGLIHPSNELISLLNSIGIWFEVVDFKLPLEDNYSLLIVENSNSITTSEIKSIKKYIEDANPVLEISTSPIFYTQKVNTSYSKTVYNTRSDSEFDRIPYLDIYSKIARSTDSNILSGLIDFKIQSNNSLVGFFGLDLSEVFSNIKYTRKRFLSKSGDLPDELSSTISRDSISDALELTIQYLFHAKNLPFIKKWHSPSTKPVFGFRIDSDYGTKDSLKEVYNLLKKHSLKGSWFLHVKAHENWLDWFKSLENQELALHGYEHGYSSSVVKIKQNIAHGLEIMANNDIYPKGFCSPYGIWNTGIKKSLEQFEFEYSSEFTSGYDSLPFKNRKTDNLQIPIHPVCTGSLSRKGYSFDEMKSYFLDIYKQKIGLFKPILFYHHPLQSNLAVFDKVFEKAVSDELTNLTFIEYSTFWKKRDKLKFSATIENDQIKIHSTDSGLMLYVSVAPENFTLISSDSQKIPIQIDPVFKYDSPSLPSSKELQNLHGNRLRMLKTSVLDWRNRNRL